MKIHFPLLPLLLASLIVVDPAGFLAGPRVCQAEVVPQGDAATETPDKPRELKRLPPPLEDVIGGLHELERSGHFRLLQMEMGRPRVTEMDAVVWTVRVVRPLTYRHALLLLRRVGDVRIARVRDDWQKQLLRTRLAWPDWIESGAVHGDVLDRDAEFEVWIDLDARTVGTLRRDQANRIVFLPLPL